MKVLNIIFIFTLISLLGCVQSTEDRSTKSPNTEFQTSDCILCHSEIKSSGAHITHTMSCFECHQESIHQDGFDSEEMVLEWGALSTTDNMNPVWDKETKGCSNIYCHGNSLPGGGLSRSWDNTEQSIECISCHTELTQNSIHNTHATILQNCSECHPSIESSSEHINGIKDPILNSKCTDCHSNNNILSDSHTNSVATTSQCLECHDNNLIAEHITNHQLDCITCHGSSETNVVNAIENNLQTCTSCHDQNLLHSTHTAIIRCSECHSMHNR